MFVSYKRIPTVASKKSVQALDTEDTALLASTANYEFHPDDRVKQPRMRERAVDSIAPNSPSEETRKNSKRRDRTRDFQEAESMGGSGSRAQEGLSPRICQGGAGLRPLPQDLERRSRVTVGSHR